MKRIAAVLLLLSLVSPALARSEPDEAVRATLLRQAETLRDEEEATAGVAAELAAFDQRLAELSAEEGRRRAELTRLLAALARLSRLPPAAIVSRPEGGEAVVNTRQRDGYFVVDRIARGFVLRRGSEVTHIYNDGFRIEEASALTRRKKDPWWRR